MNQGRGANSSNDKEMLTMAEEELARLHRQLRIMDEDRIAFLEETGTKLKKQRKIMQTLKREREKISEEINVATCLNQKRNDEKLVSRMKKLVEDYEKYDSMVKTEKEQLKELEVQIKKMDADIQNLRPKAIITDYDYENRLRSGNHSIKILKDRLENAVKRFCAILTENKKMREEIDHLLKERTRYNIIWESLLKDMQSRKKYMVELIEQATVAFDQREEWCSKLAALKKRAQSDYLAHTEEMREIQRKLDHDFTLREFLSTKGQKRILKDLEEKERKKKEIQIQNLENRLIMLEDTMKQIQKFCDEKDVHKMASQYLKQEEENFALFNYVNELNHEIEMLEESLEEIQTKIDEQIEISQLKEKERQHNLEYLRAQLDIVTRETLTNEENVKNSENKVKAILEGIEDIFDLLLCDRGPILGLLGTDSSMNLFNVKIYLGTIEKKITGLITRLYFAEKAMMTQFKKFHRGNFVPVIN
ncbi:coiled-coil domain-containing protein 63 [Diabrotica undecimpunctata]|uniref:coiled-coil domain-containing protein 63 n=1 Tax=Diabrotica undecimpunctata TaxID=50387 RepID=UPI003B631E9C